MKKIFSLILTVLSLWLPQAMGILMLAGALWLRNLHLAITGLVVIAVAALFGLLMKYATQEAAARQTNKTLRPPPT